MAKYRGTTRRYICSARYEEGGSSRYLLRDLYSSNMGKELNNEVIELFVKDLQESTYRGKTGDWDSELAEDEKEKIMGGVQLTGKLTDLSIDELGVEKATAPLIPKKEQVKAYKSIS